METAWIAKVEVVLFMNRVSQELSTARVDLLGLCRRDYAAHGHGRVLLPAFGKVLDLLCQIHVADVASLYHQIVGGSQDLKRVDFSENVSRCSSLGGSEDDLKG